jgi:3-methyladenine DNA glycosylase AlkD
MEFAEVMQTLEEMGTAQNRKVYGRHGVKGEQFGVSLANLKKLKKQTKTDQSLAESLWATGNHDARHLATMVASPKKISEDTLDSWVKDLDNYVISDAFSGLVNQTPFSQAKMEAWTEAESEWAGQVGWNLLAHLAMKDKTLPDDYFAPYLDTIAQDIHTRKNRVRYSMNSALIAIGIRNERLHTQALKVAEQIGVVEVDHGQTNCKTPDAIDYMERTLARQKQKA